MRRWSFGRLGELASPSNARKMAATATLRGVLRGDGGPAAAACLQRGLARCGVVSLGSASSSGGSPIPWDGRGLEGLKHANGADASRPFATLVSERSACAWPSGSRAGHHSLQFTRSFKSRKSFYWPNIKKQWDRETPPELETLQVPDLPEEYTVTGTFSDKYKKPEGRETEVRLHSKAPSPNPDVVVRARLTGAGAGLPFPSVWFPSILFGVA